MRVCFRCNKTIKKCAYCNESEYGKGCVEPVCKKCAIDYIGVSPTIDEWWNNRSRFVKWAARLSYAYARLRGVLFIIDSIFFDAYARLRGVLFSIDSIFFDGQGFDI